ncbi:hypothetical protein [Xanthobacter agilis]|uniref:hypothetical protein n=1 Tax=Xanthobacter agilis TaxID=47492 RepID=UPI003729AF80
MARKTFYVVQPYELGKRGALKASAPMEARSAEHAQRMAQRTAATKAGAIAFSREVDPESDDAEPPVLIASYGRVPEGVMEAG